MKTIQSNIDHKGVLTLSMNRPDVHNAFDSTMIGELTRALKVAADDNDISVIILTGIGSSFSAGADANWMRSQVEASQEENQQDAMELARLMRTLNYLQKPTIARINGAAFGGGLGLVAACDITIAVDSAMFGLTEARLGLAPAVISPYVFRRIGERFARRYFMTGERFDGQKALEIGLIQQCVAADKLDEAVETVTGQLLKGGPVAVTICKQLVFAVAGHNKKSQKSADEYTSGLIAGMRSMDEGQEGLTAFLEKRKPGWIAD